MKTKIRKAHD